jgi:hypothetical protein
MRLQPGIAALSDRAHITLRPPTAGAKDPMFKPFRGFRLRDSKSELVSQGFHLHCLASPCYYFPKEADVFFGRISLARSSSTV